MIEISLLRKRGKIRANQTLSRKILDYLDILFIDKDISQIKRIYYINLINKYLITQRGKLEPITTLSRKQID